tara:strand:+ start:2572 stop:4563 length:1992 start_codon:yes stop_codon:yes gene_type:complete
MASPVALPEGFVLDKPQASAQALPEGFVLDTPLQPTTAPVAPAAAERPNILERIGGGIAAGGEAVVDMFTGEGQLTPEIEALNEVGAAPELNDFTSATSLSAGAKSLLATSQKDLEGILTASFGDAIDFRNDKKGNIIAILPSGEYALNKPGFSFQDIPEAALQAVGFSPVGRLAKGGIALAAAKTAAGGAGAAAVLDLAEELAGGEDFDLKQPLIAGLLGGTFKVAENVIGGGYRALRGNADNAVVSAGEAANIPVLTSDVFQPEGFASKAARTVGEQIPVAGTAGTRQAQQRARQEAIQDIAERHSSFSYDAIVESLVKGTNKLKRAAGQRFEVFGNKLDELGEMPIGNTIRSVVQARKILNKPAIKETQAGKDLANVVEFLSDNPQSYKSIAEGRTQLNEIINSIDSAERSQLGTRGMSVLKGVAANMKRDMRIFAREHLTPQENQKLTRAFEVYAGEARILTKSRVKNVLDKGDITPERVKDLLFSKNRSEVKILFDRLTTEGKENARAALIQQTLKDLGGEAGDVSVERFTNAMKKRSDAINVIFRGDEKKRLNGLIKVLDNTREAARASTSTPTGQQLIAPLAIAGVGASAAGSIAVPTIAAIATVGGLARVYESKVVRNALIKLSSIKRGTTAFEKNAKIVTDALTVAAQVQAQEQ